MIRDVQTAGALPALDVTMRFAAQRHKLIASNIANLDTPDYRPLDVPAASFQRQLGAAIDARRDRTRGTHGSLDLGRTREIRHDAWGNVVLTARHASGNILFHDRNNRDVERTLQDLVENSGMLQLASSLARRGFELMRTAIAERA